MLKMILGKCPSEFWIAEMDRFSDTDLCMMTKDDDERTRIILQKDDLFEQIEHGIFFIVDVVNQ